MQAESSRKVEQAAAVLTQRAAVERAPRYLLRDRVLRRMLAVGRTHA